MKMTSSFILSSLISLGIMGLVLLYFFYLRRKSPEDVPSGEHIDTSLQDKIDDMAGKYDLTPRERDVLSLLMAKPDAQVSRLAEELGISRTMMYRYLNKLYEKTKTGNKDELTGLF
jgi:DNA-binding CsgD family transcriptional regulator